MFSRFSLIHSQSNHDASAPLSSVVCVYSVCNCRTQDSYRYRLAEPTLVWQAVGTNIGQISVACQNYTKAARIRIYFPARRYTCTLQSTLTRYKDHWSGPRASPHGNGKLTQEGNNGHKYHEVLTYIFTESTSFIAWAVPVCCWRMIDVFVAFMLSCWPFFIRWNSERLILALSNAYGAVKI